MNSPDATSSIATSMADLPRVGERIRRVLLEAGHDASPAPSAIARVATVAGQAVADAFQSLVREAPPAGPEPRRASLIAVADRLEEVFGAPRIRFPAERESVDGVEGGDTVVYRVTTSRGERRIRFSQVVSARFWRLEVAPSEAAVEARLARAIVRRALTSLVSDLVSLRRIESWLGKRSRLGSPPRFNPDVTGRSFEQLVLDVLNEHADVARRASLYEDFVEKTDLRYKLPEGPSRGIRLQVTLTTHPESLRVKRSRVDSHRPPIEISPASLAAVLMREGERLLSDAELDELWAALPNFPADEAGLGRALQQMFRGTLLLRDVPPGPALELVAPCRKLLRAVASGG